MKLKKEKKDELVRGLKTRITESPTMYLADFTGLSVKNMTDLRRRFRSAGVEFLVAVDGLGRSFRSARFPLTLVSDPSLARPDG